MELLEHGGDAATGDGLGAAGAERAALGVIVSLAIRHSLVIEERAAVEGLSTVLRGEKEKEEGDKSGNTLRNNKLLL